MASSGYSVINSLSPMMFRKQKKKQDGGTRNERMRSKSVENIVDTIPPKKKDKRSGSTPFHGKNNVLAPAWKEVALVKSTSPPITCILPAASMDFVASALLAVGAVPLITEDPADIPKDLANCKAVVLDVSAPQNIIETFIDEFAIGSCPLILVASQTGTNDRKKDLAVRVIEDSGPTLITGRLGDIYAVAQAIEEKTCSPLESLSSSDDEEVQNITTPKVVLQIGDNEEEQQRQSPENLPPVLRRAKFRKAASSSPAGSPKITSPEPSPVISPRTTPRGSPVNSPRGVRKLIKRGKSTGQAFERVPTCLPRLHMKGQFRETQMYDVSVTDALEQAQKLAAHTKAFINLHETNVVTNGEIVVEISNNQLGMGNLHSTLQVCGSVAAAVLACVKPSAEAEEEDDIQLKHCSHALALYYVAGEEGAASASETGKGLIAPGTLRQLFVDALNYLDERTVQEKAEMFAYSEGTNSCKKQPYIHQ